MITGWDIILWCSGCLAGIGIALTFVRLKPAGLELKIRTDSDHKVVLKHVYSVATDDEGEEWKKGDHG